MAHLTAIKEHRYGGRQRFPGDDYEAGEKDARLLKAVGKAKEKEPGRKAVDLPKRAEKVETAKEDDELSPESSGGRGQYQRRDMTAEPAGQTGETPSPSSSRADPAPSKPTSLKPASGPKRGGWRSRRT